LISVAELLTVDVWDTLLRRRCHPDCVKLHVCRFLALKCWPYLAVDLRNPWALLRQRQLAEQLIGDENRAKDLDDEYRHLEVYERWLGLIGLMPFPLGSEALQDLLTSLENIEVAQERFVSYPDPTVREILAGRAEKRKLFLSDFYLPASLVRGLLQHHGLDDQIADGFVSCDVALNKRSGRLYRYVQERLDVIPAKHAHIGDNAHSDVRIPSAAGIEAVHFLPEAENEKRLQREADFASRHDALRRAAESIPIKTPSVAGLGHEAYRFGQKCSLMFVGFVMFVMERAIADRVERLFFFTREGEFFLEIYRRLAEWDVLGCPVPQAVLLEVSRLSTFAPSMRGLSVKELMRIWNQYSSQSLRALLRSLAIDDSPFEDLARKHDLELDRVVQYPWQDERVTRFLEDPEVRGRIERHIRERRTNALAYLNSVGLSDDNECAGVVDIGWRGTIQDNLAAILPTVTLRGYYLALSGFLNPQPENVTKSAFGPDLNRTPEFAYLLDCVAPVEMMCNSPNGSITHYDLIGAAAIAQRNTDVSENKVYESWTRHFQAGVLDSAAYWAEFLRTHAYSGDEVRPAAVEMWAAIIRRPPKSLADAYFQLNHNESFGVGEFVDRKHTPTIGDFALMPFSLRRRNLVREFVRNAGWVQGLCASGHLGFGLRAGLVAVSWLASVRARLRRHLSP
jgi:FMN phosphatase YigB (HAD superfamily)